MKSYSPPSSTLWQTTSWEKVLLSSWQATKVIHYKHFFIEKRYIGLGMYGLFLLWVTSPITKEEEEAFITITRKEKCLFFQIETYGTHVPVFEKTDLFQPWYFKKFIRPCTVLLSLEESLENIFQYEIKPKCRYNIRYAEKKWIVVKEAEKNEENIEIFTSLMKETTLRKGFSSHQSKYFHNFLTYIPNSKLLFATVEKEILAWGIFIFWNHTSLYYYGGSKEDKRKAPYLLQWKAIKLAKEYGSTYYDFFGIACPEEKNSPLQGVTQFKKQFAKDIVKISESYIYIAKPYIYSLVQIWKKIKHFL